MLPPAAGDEGFSGATANVQPLSCDTVKVCPAIVTVPLRAAPVLTATVIWTVPSPVPLPPEVIEIQGTFDAAVQAQDPGAVTAAVVTPPAAGIWRDAGAIEKVQPAVWVTVKVCPPAVMVPVRSGPLFGATVRATAPFPEPLLPAVIEIHGALLVAVQSHPAAAWTSNDRVPPALSTDVPAAESE